MANESLTVVYIAGPYRADTINATLTNIARARESALSVWRAGYVALCPHLNSALMDGAVPDQTFLDGDLELLARCDAMLCLTGAEKSEGTTHETQRARELQIPIYYTLYDLTSWGKKGEKP